METIIRPQPIVRQAIPEMAVVPMFMPAEEKMPETLPFIEANTKEVTLEHLTSDCIIPVFSKDNEVTISHQTFIDTVLEAAHQVFPYEDISSPAIRVSHIVKGTIRKQTYSGRMVANFSVVTEYAFKDKTGGSVIETTWHNVVAWQDGDMPLELLEKGASVCVQGRLRCRRYTSESGEPRTSYEVIAASVNIVP